MKQTRRDQQSYCEKRQRIHVQKNVNGYNSKRFLDVVAIHCCIVTRGMITVSNIYDPFFFHFSQIISATIT